MSATLIYTFVLAFIYFLKNYGGVLNAVQQKPFKQSHKLVVNKL